MPSRRVLQDTLLSARRPTPAPAFCLRSAVLSFLEKLSERENPHLIEPGQRSRAVHIALCQLLSEDPRSFPERLSRRTCLIGSLQTISIAVHEDRALLEKWCNKEHCLPMNFKDRAWHFSVLSLSEDVINSKKFSQDSDAVALGPSSSNERLER